MLVFHKPSLPMRLVSFTVSLAPTNFRPEKVERLWAKIMDRQRALLARPPASLALTLRISQRLVGNQPIFEISRPRHSSNHHILYFPGGAYINPLHPAHWLITSSLIKHTGADVTLATYPLAPEHSYRDAMAHIEAVYRETLVRHPGQKIVVVGDLAGGSLALALAIICREKSLPMPARLVLFAPWLDITMTDPGAAEVEADDIMLRVEGLRCAGLMWAAGDDPKDPLLSPLYADLAELPPIAIFQGTADIFICDARTFSRKAESAQVPMELFEYEGAFHVFMCAPFTPEARDTFRRVGQLLQ